MEEYFGRLLAEWSRRFNSLPMVPWSEGVDPEFYEGPVDEEGWVQWKPTEMDIPLELSALETQLNITLHESIKAYFGAYWFCSLGGQFFDKKIQLESVLPGVGVTDFLCQLTAYRTAHEGRLDHIPIGVESSSARLVVVENHSGEVKLEDYHSRDFEPLANNLKELIQNLTV